MRPDSTDATVFAALGDTHRLDLLERLGVGGAATATRLAEPLSVTRQAVSRHLRVLQDAGLVRTHRSGRDVLYTVEADALREGATWLSAHADAWDRRLRDLKERAEEGDSGRRRA